MERPSQTTDIPLITIVAAHRPWAEPVPGPAGLEPEKARCHASRAPEPRHGSVWTRMILSILCQRFTARPAGFPALTSPCEAFS